MVPRRSLYLATAALVLSSAVSYAQTQSGKVFARYNRPLRSVTLDLATGTVTGHPVVHDRAATTVVDFRNMDLSGFTGVDSGNGFCEWFDAGVKGDVNNASDLMSSFVFSYCSSKLTPASGGPGGSVRLGFYEGYQSGGSPSTAVAAFTLAGLPGNTASSSFFGGFRCFFMRVEVNDLVCFADGPIGYSWRFLDSGTNTINPLGSVVAGTWPFLSCVASCSGTGPADGQGMVNSMDAYCPPGTLRSMFSFGTSAGTYASMSMNIEEVTTKVGTVGKYNSASFPNPDELCADVANVGRPWTASMTLGLNRLANNWVMFFGMTPSDFVLAQDFNGLNFGTNKNGRVLLCTQISQIRVVTAHTGVLGSTSTSAPVDIPKQIALVCNSWCAQAVVVGGVAPGDGGGGVRLSSAVSGVVGTNDPPPTADFAGVPLSGVAPLDVTFTDLSTGAVTAWSWSFGDGGMSSVQNPVHSYVLPGTYTVSLTVEGPDGMDTLTKVDYVVANAPVVADFSGTPLSGAAPLNVSFTDLSTGSPTSWSWDFGDTGSSALQNPSHDYTTPGTYTVTLTATGPGGSDMETKVDYVVVNVPVVADFSGSPLSGTAPLNVSFTDLSTGSPTSWSWDFGDTGSSALQNPSHDYAVAGTYTVTLTATGPGGSDMATKVDYVVVSEPAPVADFSGTPLSGTAPLAVNFTDLSSGAVTSWSWDFGDTGSSTLQNPSHNYAVAGTYTVTLTATGPGGSDMATKVDYVVVSEPAPVADFSGTPLSGTAPLDVTFTDLSTGAVTSWSWDFGDTGSSTLQNPSHSYTTPGTYSVTLTVTGPGGSDPETKVDYVTVN